MMMMIAYTQISYGGYSSSGYHHHHHVGDCDHVEDSDDFDDTVDDHDDPGVPLVSVYGNLSQCM